MGVFLVIRASSFYPTWSAQAAYYEADSRKGAVDRDLDFGFFCALFLRENRWSAHAGDSRCKIEALAEERELMIDATKAGESGMLQNNPNIERVLRSKEDAKAAYDRMSTRYDLIAGWSEKKYRDRGVRLLQLSEGDVVLEIGFGTGHAIVNMANVVGRTGKVFGIDISEGMLEIAASRVKEAGLSERVQLKLGDGANLPFGANLFDAVFMSFTLELFDTPEIPKVLVECKRVLKSGGRICIVGMSKTGGIGMMMRMYEWAHRTFPKYVDCRPIFVQGALKNAGLEIAEAEQVRMWGLAGEIVLARKSDRTD